MQWYLQKSSIIKAETAKLVQVAKQSVTRVCMPCSSGHWLILGEITCCQTNINHMTVLNVAMNADVSKSCTFKHPSV